MYSQNNEQQIILDYFNGFHGTFIDIGANDGITFSNTRSIAELGWKGVCLEPSPKAFEKLKKLYDGHKNIYCYPFALSDHNGKAMLQQSGPLCSAADVGLVSSFSMDEIMRWKFTKAPDGDWYIHFDPVEVKTFRWKTFLNRLKNLKGFEAKFDMISLDIEGHEMQVLPQIDLSNTKLVCIEWNSIAENKVQFDKYMDGFKVIYTSAENLIYAR